MLRKVVVMLLLMFSLCKSAVTKAQTINFKNVSIKWEVVENNHKGENRFLSALTLKNESQVKLPKVGWRIYFSFVRTIEQASVTGGVTIKFINGDLYELSPASNFKSIEAGASLRIEFVSSDWAVNVTDAPTGFYVVWDNTPETGTAISNFSINPSTEPKQYLRFAGDNVGLITPQIIYEQNLYIKDISLDKLTKIFPTPTSYKETQTPFNLNTAVTIVADESFQGEAEYLANELHTLLGKKPTITSSLPSTSVKFIHLTKSEMAAEAYQLKVQSDRISISASTATGIFYGIQSLKSLIPGTAWSKIQKMIDVPGVEVVDAPRFSYRGFFLDVCRNFHSKKQVMKILDLMALYKLNVFHFHLTDDEGWRIEIPSLPELTAIGSKRGHTLDSKNHLPPSFGSGPDVNNLIGSGYYTKAEFIEILKYATARHIQVIPEIETPGHARAAVKSMEARYNRLMKAGKREEAEKFLLTDLNDNSVYKSVQGWNDNVINVAIPSTYRFLETVTDELLTMYKEANSPITTIHFGGDEVPSGVWEKSPAVLELMKQNSSIKTVDDLWYYYYGKVNDMVKKKGLYLYGWEEIGMRKTQLDNKPVSIPNPNFVNENFHLDVWNNVLGWGAEDLAYQLANAGYKVVLSCVSHQYFDMAYYKAFDEPGYYWGAFVDVDKPFSFIPYDYFKNSKEDKFGSPIDKSIFIGKEKLTDYGKTNILGVKGLLWSETITSPERLEYMILPKMLGLAERAWASDPDWSLEQDLKKSDVLYQEAWSHFTNIIGKRELPRLDHYAGGFNYRIPAVGAFIEDGKVIANIQLPGLSIRYTTDGKEPTLKSKVYSSPVTNKGKIKFKAFNTKGRGGSTIQIENK